MQVIEKVKVVPEGYNGAGMNYDGGNRRNAIPNANNGTTQNRSLFYLSKF